MGSAGMEAAMLIEPVEYVRWISTPRAEPSGSGQDSGMKLKMHDNSLFAILMRSPWWVSGGIAAALFAIARLALPAAYSEYAFFASLPFLVICIYVGATQLRAPSEAGIAENLTGLRALSWNDFSAAIESAYQRDGYTVARITTTGADLELTKDGRVTLVGCKRWKVARTGIEPLRELDTARRARDAHEGVYVATGEVTENARAFAQQNGIRLIQGAELVKLLPAVARSSAAKQ